MRGTRGSEGPQRAGGIIGSGSTGGHIGSLDPDQLWRGRDTLTYTPTPQTLGCPICWSPPRTCYPPPFTVPCPPSPSQNLLCLKLAEELGATVPNAFFNWMAGALLPTLVGE